jgi:hypothetical protein
VGRLGAQVHIVEAEIVHFGQSRPGVGVQADRRLVAKLGEAFALALVQQPFGVVLGDDGDQLLRRLGLADPVHRRSVDLALAGQPLEELLQALVFVQRGRRRPRLNHPGLERLHMRPGHHARVGRGGVGVRVGGVLSHVPAELRGGE